MQTALSSSVALYPKGRAPADPATFPARPFGGEPRTLVLGPDPSHPRPGHCSLRERLWAVTAAPAEQFLPPARIGSARGSPGNSPSTTRITLFAAPFLTAQKNWLQSCTSLCWRHLLGRGSPVRGLAAGHGADTGGQSPRPPGRARSRGAAGTARRSGCAQTASGRGLFPPQQHSQGQREGEGREGARAPRRGRGAAGGAGTDLASGAVPQHHQLELAVRTLLLLRVRHDLYGPGENEEAESSREETGAGARAGQREERAPRSRSRQ